jgi:tetratricopeptide (TPR) repeat protein
MPVLPQTGVRPGQQGPIISACPIDFFISRRGSAAQAAQEVADVLSDEGYSVRVQDYHFGPGVNFIAAIDDALRRCRDLIVLLTKDYALSVHTMSTELGNFLAAATRADGERALIVLRLEDCDPEGVMAAHVYGDLTEIEDPGKRREVILAAINRMPTALRPPRRTVHGLPPRNRDFVGRDDMIGQLHATLLSAESPAPMWLNGLGGIGKSSLAAEYAHRCGGDYAGVWWARAENRTMLIDSLAELARALDDRLGSTFLPRITEPPDLEKLAQTGLAKLAARRKPWLLIYDNVVRPAAIEGLIPPGGAARLIITTRYSDWPSWATEMRVETMPRDAAAELLLKRRGGNREDAARLAHALGYLPLALDHADAYLRRTGSSFTRYTARVEELIGKNVGDQASVRATFDLAIQRATEERPAAESVLAFLSVLAPERVPLDIIDETIVTDAERDDALIALTAVSLVRLDPFPDETEAITVHRLVQAAARARNAAADGNRAIIEKAIRRLGQAFPDNGYSEPRSWPRCEKLMPHALELREQAHRANIANHDFAFLLDATANALHGRGAFDAAVSLLQEAVAIARSVLAPRHVNLGQWLNNLANIYMNTARYAQAEPLYREAIEIGTETLGRGSFRVATRISNLANLLMETGRYEESERLFREALQTVATTRSKGDPMYAARLRSLALLLYRTERFEGSEVAYREAIAIGVTASGQDDPHVVLWRGQLANVLRDTGRAGEAEPLYRVAVEKLATSLGPVHPSVAGARRELARLLITTGRAEEGLAHAQEALAAHEQTFGRAHTWTAGSAAVVADALHALGRGAEAVDVRAMYRSGTEVLS